MPAACFLEAGRNRQRWIQTRGTKKITKILWFPGSQQTDLARAGGKTRWMEAPVEAEEVGVDSRAWARRGEGLFRRILMDLGETMGVMAEQVATMTLFLDLEVWARAVVVVVGIRVVEAGGMEGTVVAVGMGVPGGMTIAITTGEVTTEGEAITEVVGVVTAHVGEVAAVVVEGVEDTELLLIYALLQ